MAAKNKAAFLKMLASKKGKKVVAKGKMKGKRAC